MDGACCIFVVGIHPSRTWLSGSFVSVRWNVCQHRLHLGLYSYLKEFWGNGVRTHEISKGKILSTVGSGKSNPQRFIRQDSEPNTLYYQSSSGSCTECPATSRYTKECLAPQQIVSNQVPSVAAAEGRMCS